MENVETAFVTNSQVDRRRREQQVDDLFALFANLFANYVMHCCISIEILFVSYLFVLI